MNESSTELTSDFNIHYTTFLVMGVKVPEDTILPISSNKCKVTYGSLDIEGGNMDRLRRQPELEKHVGVGGYGYSAFIALNITEKKNCDFCSKLRGDPSADEDGTVV
ncbi:hypothetical protein Tco_0780688 [Tanacetum coccineum]